MPIRITPHLTNSDFLKILTLIQSQPTWGPDRLAVECATTRRSIFRDLRMLSAAGIPCFYDRESRGYSVGRDFFLPALSLTLDESLALVALAEQISAREQIPMMAAAAKAIVKVRCNLPAGIQRKLQEIDPYLNIQLPAVNKSEQITDIYQKVRWALRQKRRLTCQYEAASSAGAGRSDGPFLFEPYTLFFSQRAWYAVGHHHGRRAVRCLKLNRFSACQPTEQSYRIPRNFSLQKHLGNAWRMIRGEKRYPVELWFDPAFGETIEDTHWHRSQEVIWHEDQSITFRVKVDGLDEIVWWVLSMGPHCKVLKPRELATKGVYELARRLIEQYGGATVR